MLRSSRSRFVALVVVCGSAGLLWMLLHTPADTAERIAAAPEASSGRPERRTRKRVESHPGPEARTGAPRSGPRVPPKVLRDLYAEDEAPKEEDRVIHGMTAEERRAKGFTPKRLFASRSGARLDAMAMLVERLGHEELAQSMVELSEEFRTAHETQDEDQVGWDELMTRQHDVMQQVLRVLATENTDSPFYTALAAKSVTDIEDAMSGNLESVDRKLEEESNEDRVKADEADEVKTGDQEGEAEASDAREPEPGAAEGSDPSSTKPDEADGR